MVKVLIIAYVIANIIILLFFIDATRKPMPKQEEEENPSVEG